MRLNHFLVLIVLSLLISCSRKSPSVELSNPGFGILASSIDSRSIVNDIPVLIRIDEEIKGIQFTLRWDEAIVKVGQPQLNDLNSGFTVSTGNQGIGQMKVLVFSMTGDVLDTSNPEFMTIPVSIVDAQATEVSLVFDRAVFAGPNATSYDIPITHAKLKVERL